MHEKERKAQGSPGVAPPGQQSHREKETLWRKLALTNQLTSCFSVTLHIAEKMQWLLNPKEKVRQVAGLDEAATNTAALLQNSWVLTVYSPNVGETEMNKQQPDAQAS